MSEEMEEIGYMTEDMLGEIVSPSGRGTGRISYTAWEPISSQKFYQDSRRQSSIIWKESEYNYEIDEEKKKLEEKHKAEEKKKLEEKRPSRIREICCRQGLEPSLFRKVSSETIEQIHWITWADPSRSAESLMESEMWKLKEIRLRLEMRKKLPIRNTRSKDVLRRGHWMYQHASLR